MPAGKQRKERSPTALFERVRRMFLLFGLGYVSFVLLPLLHKPGTLQWTALCTLPVLPILWLGEERRHGNSFLWDLAEASAIFIIAIAGQNPQTLVLLLYSRISLRTLDPSPLAAAGKAMLYIGAYVGPVVILTASKRELISVGHIAPALGFVLAAILMHLLATMLQRLERTLSREQELSRERASLAKELHEREGEERFRALVQNSSDVVMVLNAGGTITYESPSVKSVLGYEPEVLLGTTFIRLLHPDDSPGAVAVLTAGMRHAGPTALLQWRMRHADGRWLHCEIVGTNLLEHPRVKGFVFTARDITDRKALEEQLRYRAFHDPLTQLPNRALFFERLEHALTQRRRSPRQMAVLLLDIDDFKTINDSLGHGAGDELLVRVAARLQGCLRESDTAARLGGDEFAMLLEDTNPRDAEGVADKLLRTLATPFVVADQEVFVHASIGIAPANRSATDPEELLRNADVAMYIAKAEGKATYQVFQPKMHAAALHRLEMSADLRYAVEREQLYLQYQPVVDLATSTLVGVEALVRWDRGPRGNVEPGDFIGLAEETGSIVPIGRWVLESACLQARAWRDRTPKGTPLHIAVNVSARQIHEPGFLADVKRILEETGIAPETLTLEITETVLVGDADQAISVLSALDKMGVKLAVDDFGTGYSSLSYLRRFPLHILKIDKSFVDGIADGLEESALARAIARIAHTLGMQVIAEGIQTEAQLEVLKSMRCHMGQGFYFSRPVYANEIDALLDEAMQVAVTA
jgi:diguanylate cyclase (GGDEF)-like protein/PAS domain S-box-containing protein